MTANRTFFQRVRRRKLVQWTAAYVTAAAALFGTLDTVGQVFEWPDGLMRAVFFVLMGGLFSTAVLAWYHGEKGRQRVGPGEALLLCGTVLFGVSGAGYSLFAGHRSAEADAPPTPRVLILPFTDADGDGDQQYLADGLADELRRALGTMRGMEVARGGAGGATHVLDGSVARTEMGIRIVARVADAGGAVLWEDRFEEAALDLFDVESRIVTAVARAVGPSGTGEPDAAGAPTGGQGPAPRPVPVDPVAHDHYLRGEYALKQRSPASVVQAISQYRTAWSLDANHTAAVAREAYAYTVFVDWGWTYPGMSAEELMRRATELSDRAVRQDSLSAEAWLARAYVLQVQDPQRMHGATDAFGRAVALDPTNPEAQHQYGQTLMALGRYAEAKSAYHAALAVEPERPLTLVPLGAIALREGDPEAARRWADSAVSLASDAPYAWASRGQLRLAGGDARGARTDAERALQIDPSYELPGQGVLAAALAALGDETVAEQTLARARRAMVRPDRPSTTEAYYLANALLHMGRREEALRTLESARPRGVWLWFYFQSPTFDPIRQDERFRRVMEVADPRPGGQDPPAPS